ncbi:IPT/TIG domain-containing protein, partial [Candidatus Saccharibacteria bacterium]|nr:IPT/TIG domain-containing protein [Candidatus Saccharibacteria bacterium]
MNRPNISIDQLRQYLRNPAFVSNRYFRIKRIKPIFGIIITIVILGGLLLGVALQQPNLTDALTLTGVSPSSGPTAGGTAITITGTDFQQKLSFRQISTGGYHTCGIATNNQVYCWGQNDYGQLGDGTLNNKSTPVAVNTAGVLNGKIITQIAAGDFHTCALDSTGKAYCWGQNTNGQVGDNSSGNNRTTPVAVNTTGVLNGKTLVQISLGQYHTCAVDSAGVAYCWGYNNGGQLGDNSLTSRSVPIAVNTAGVLGGKYLIQIAGGYSFSCALDSTGKVYCWGNNSQGSLGNNSNTNSPVPVAVYTAGVLNNKVLTQMSSNGSYHTCVIDTDGKAYCWGYNTSGQVGDNSTSNRNAPVAVNATGVLNGKTLTQITTGDALSCALDSTGKAYCWGQNTNGQIGDNSSGSNRLVPVAVYTAGVLNGKTLSMIAFGTHHSHTCALDTEGMAYCWGLNSSYQLGDNTVTQRTAPVSVVTTNLPAAPVTVTLDGVACTSVTVISNTELTCNTPAHPAGKVDVSVTINGGTVTMAKAYEYGPSFTVTGISPSSGPAAGSTSVTITGTGFEQNLVWKQVSVGGQHTCAIASNDQAYCWGQNNSGQLGDTTHTSSFTPVAVDTSGALSGLTIKEISVGDNFSCAIASDGWVYCWGYNNDGRLGDNSIAERTTPTAIYSAGVLGGLTIKHIDAGYSHTCVVASNDQAYCWGSNSQGELGDNTYANKAFPVAVVATGALSGLGVKEVSAGYWYTCAIASNDRAYCWGQNSGGKLGNNSTAISNVPVAVFQGAMPSLVVKQISTGQYHTCVIASNDQAYCWGQNTNGQVGDNTSGTNRLIPTVVYTAGVLNGLSIKQITAGQTHTCAIASNDRAYCWGQNTYGQLGNNSNVQSIFPVAVYTSGSLSGLGVKQISANYQYTCAVASDSWVYCWGMNSVGQLGDNTNASRSVPTAVDATSLPLAAVTVTLDGSSCTNVVVVSNTELTCDTPAHSAGTVDVAVTIGGGTVTLPLAYNYYSLTVDSITPDHGPIEGGTTVTITGTNFEQDIEWKQISAGRQHTCAIRADNDQAYCWGYNYYGQLGIDSSGASNKFVPTAVTGLLNGVAVKQISAGDDYTCAIRADNDQAYCWGYNYYGQLGIGSSGASHKSTPTAVTAPLSGVAIKQISAGNLHTCAIRADNDQVYCWGRNHLGQLGDGGSGAGVDQSIPTAVTAPLSGIAIKQISVGHFHTCAIRADNNQAYCWGYNSSGQLGDGTSGTANNKSIPTAVTAPLSGIAIKEISAGYDYTCAIRADNDEAYCWGHNYYGQLGDSTSGNGTNKSIPTAVTAPLSGVAIKQISAVATGTSAYHTCAIRADNEQAYCWGRNNYGQIGDGTSGAGTDKSVPTAVTSPLSGIAIKQISVGYFHTCAIRADNDEAYCWGYNNYGQLGNGTSGSTNDSSVPVPVDTTGLPPAVPTVTFDLNGTPASCIDVIVVDSSTITCETTAHLAGVVDVAVTIGSETKTLTSAFEYIEYYVSLALDSNSVSIGGPSGLVPTTVGVFGSGTNTVTVKTNYDDGYGLFISTNQASSNPQAKDLKHLSLSEYIAGTANTCSWNA